MVRHCGPSSLKSSRLVNNPVGVDAIASLAVKAFHQKSSPSLVDLNRSMLFIQQAYRIEAVKSVELEMSKALTAYLNRVVDVAATVYSMMGAEKAGGRKLSPEAHEAVWRQALEQEQRSAAPESLTSLPVIESTALGTYTKISELLSGGAKDGKLSEVVDKIRVSGTYLVGVVNTAKNRVMDHVKKAAESGWGSSKILKFIKERIAKIVKGRSDVSSRTEAVRGTNIGTTLAAKHAWEVSHMSVVGCTNIEANGPHYRGFPTCNIQNVLSTEAELVEFHPNHTGYWSISGMNDAEGQPPKLTIGIGSV